MEHFSLYYGAILIITGASIFIGQPTSSSQKVCCNKVTAEKSLMHESKMVFLWREGLAFLFKVLYSCNYRAGEG